MKRISQADIIVLLLLTQKPLQYKDSATRLFSKPAHIHVKICLAAYSDKKSI